MTDTRDTQCPMRLATRRFMEDPYSVLADVRESTPAAVVEAGGFRMWLVTRYEDVRALLADPAVGKDMVGNRKTLVPRSAITEDGRARLAHRSRRSLLDRDGEDHRRLRGQLTGSFKQASVARWRPLIERTAAELLDTLPVGEPIDIVSHYASPLATTVISEITGVPPHERGGFPKWQNDMLTGNNISAIEEGGRQLHELALRLVEYKRAHRGDDLFTLLLDLADAGDLDDDELVSTYIVLLVGGSEPTTAIGSGTWLLLSHPEQRAAVLADPELFASCVEEVVRHESPFRALAPRFSSREHGLDDVEIPQGELLLLSLGAANRDPARFPDPDRFDVRRDTRGHLGFGHGPHRCIGAELGRLETEIGLRMFFERFPHTTLVDEPARWRTGAFMRRLHRLTVILG